MTLYEYRATTYLHAFVLNALASALIIVIAIYIKGRFDKYSAPDGQTVVHTTNFRSLGYTFMFTFIASIGAYALMHYTLGYGGGMLTT